MVHRRSVTRAVCFGSQNAGYPLISWRGAFANDEFGLEHNFLGIFGGGGAGDALQEGFGGYNAHLAKRLPNRCEARIVEGRALNIIPADHGDIFRDTTARFAKSLDRAHGGDIVERKQCRELWTGFEKFSSDPVADFGRRRIAIELDREFFFDDDSEFPGHRENRLPASFSVRAEILAFD